MPRDPARAVDTRAWLAKAKEDLQAAKQLLKPSKALSSAAVFHCQQAAEKACAQDGGGGCSRVARWR